MSEKYHINVEPAPSRFEPISKLNHIEHNRCLGCLQCARRDCIYDVFTDRKFIPGELMDSGNRLCKACMRCVQECRNRIMIKALNPEYLELGNEYWTPEIITSLWNQADTGKIPVSGAGYGGPFSGTGFDDMWTDMSEIVRPTRDGIHGREYISTAIDIGFKPDRLHFKDGQLTDELPPLISTPLPILLDLPPHARRWPAVKQAMLHTARQLGILAFDDAPKLPDENVIARYAPEDAFDSDCSHRMLEICLESAAPETIRHFSGRVRTMIRQRPDTIIGVALPLDRHTREVALHLVDQGVSVLRVYADQNGREAPREPRGIFAEPCEAQNAILSCGKQGFLAKKGEFFPESPRFIKEVVRDIHLALVQTRRRDCVTLLAGGGIAMAEHVAKLIACGADGVVVDDALLVALECRMCRRHTFSLPPSRSPLRWAKEGRSPDRATPRGEVGCPVSLESVDAAWGMQRLINLLGSWHSQIIEVMGAMGIREIRRLRGEVGRVMFFKDLENECFAPIFGERKIS